MPLIKTDTVTIYNALGEDATGHMQWRRTVVPNVRYEVRSGAVAGVNGSSTTDGLMLFVPAPARAYVDPDEYAGSGWTLRDGDMVATGAHDEADPHLIASRAVFRITGVEPLTDRRGRLHHFEVSGA